MMTFLVALIAIPILVFAAVEYRRIKRLQSMARAERACARFGQIQHDLVMAFHAGTFRQEDLKAFRHIYLMCTQVLHIPRFLREFTTDLFVAVARDNLPKNSEGLRRDDLTARTRPYLGRTVHEIDTLIQEFAHPLATALAAVGNARVIDFVLRIRDLHHEVERRRRELESLRDEGSALLAA